MRLNRFERKILAAIAAVAIVPLVGALILGRGALREAYEVGVNARVHGELQRALEVYRDYFLSLRSSAEHAADAIAGDWVLHAALDEGATGDVQRYLDTQLQHYDNVAEIVVVAPDGTTLARARDDARLDETRMRLLRLQREARAPAERPATVRITVAAPLEPFRDYQSAGELVEVFSRLHEGRGFVSRFYLLVYIGFLLSVIVVALAAGVVMSRRVTRRVVLLSEATARVGAGDLSVQVPSDTDDEIGELTQAFNAMVRDLRESRSRIEYLQRIGAWQQFARRLAHEIKNPLTPIQLAMQEVHQGYRGEDPRYREQLDDARAIIEEEIATLRRLVGEFSDFARLPVAHLSPADLNEIVDDAARSLVAVGEEFGVQVRGELSPAPIPVRIDSMMFKRCLDNLVRNAGQAIASSGRGGTVIIRALRDGQQALVEVQDDGPGVDHSQRLRVFDPYVTTKPDGSGLGLAIVKKVVLEHHGEIECVPAPGGGATFRIRLPIARNSG